MGIKHPRQVFHVLLSNIFRREGLQRCSLSAYSLCYTVTQVSVKDPPLQQAMGIKDLFYNPHGPAGEYVYDIYTHSLVKQASTAIFVLFLFYFLLSFFSTFFTLKIRHNYQRRTSILAFTRGIWLSATGFRVLSKGP